MDFISLLKSIGGMLATITTVVYVAGYLALRARAFALGTDPGFALAYEGYLFAGFRFVLVSLIMVLLLSPVIALVVRCLTWLRYHVPDSLFVWGEWSLLVVLALCTVCITFMSVSVNGVLINVSGESVGNKKEVLRPLLEGAVMGEYTGSLVIVVAMLVTALSVIWFKARLPANDSLTWGLGLVVTLQIFLLPILHGALFADRNVRVLAATPDSVKGMQPPLAVVDRASSNISLLGLDKNNERRLVTIKVEDLNGIPVKSIEKLHVFVKNNLSHTGEKGGASMQPTAKQNENAGAPIGFFGKVIVLLQLAIEDISSLGDSVENGQIWSVEFDDSGTPTAPRRIGATSNFSYPVFDIKNQAIYALQQGRIMQLDHSGEHVKELDKQKQWIKLLGVIEDGILGMIYENNEGRFAILRADGSVTLSPEPYSDEERKARSVLDHESRAYSGKRSLSVERSARGGRGFDVYFKREGDVFNLSDCGDDHCGQPSFSPDFRRVLYVRKSRY